MLVKVIAEIFSINGPILSKNDIFEYPTGRRTKKYYVTMDADVVADEMRGHV